MTGAVPAGERWRTALGRWAIPAHILAQAPDDPFEIPPTLFSPRYQACSPTARRAALTGLASGDGSLLDVGCGSGAASLPLAAVTSRITGVDTSPAMLATFERSGVTGAARRAVPGRWPDVAPSVEPHAVAIAHHVAYNVADIEDFVMALDRHATSLVVMEVTLDHPQAALTDLWHHFHHIDRPNEPTYRDLVAVLQQLGIVPDVVIDQRATPTEPIDRGLLVRFARRRLCLGPEQDHAIDALLPQDHTAPPRDVACITWCPTGPTG